MLQVRSADGWLDLQNPAEALLELEAITSDEKNHPVVLEMFWRVYAAWQKWQPAFDVGEQLITLHPSLPAGWIDRAYAVRRMKGGGLAAACEALLPAFEWFPDEAIIPYNLACYCAQLGQLEEARKWLAAALTRGDRPTLLKMARNDPDLEPLKALGHLE